MTYSAWREDPQIVRAINSRRPMMPAAFKSNLLRTTGYGADEWYARLFPFLDEALEPQPVPIVFEAQRLISATMRSLNRFTYHVQGRSGLLGRQNWHAARRILDVEDRLQGRPLDHCPKQQSQALRIPATWLYHVGIKVPGFEDGPDPEDAYIPPIRLQAV